MMKKIIPMMMIAAAPLCGMAQGELKSGIDPTNLDLSVKPGDDFYQYACGGWMKKNPLPAAYSRYGSFEVLIEQNNVRINTILNDLLNGQFATGTVEQKLGDFYKLAMDSTRRNHEGVSPMKPLLKEMDKAKTLDDLQKIQCRYAAFGYGVPASMGFGADEKNAKMNILNVYQGGITLGQREYYLDNDEATTRIREAYKAFIVRMYGLFGYNQSRAQKAMENIMKIETALAKVSKSQTELRDVEANYNKTSRAEFERNYPHLHLTQLLNAEGVQTSTFEELVVGQPSFVAGAEQLFASLSVDELRDYMMWDAMLLGANYLSDELAAAHFDFFGRTMRGRQEDYPRWKRATNQVESQMGEALGRIYVERHFPAAAKERMERLVKNLQTSLAERIMAQTWMSDTTKTAALDKLASFYVKIGYPNKWKDLSRLTIDPKKSYYENVMACYAFRDADYIASHAGKPVDRDEWLMTPQTVNAYYNPTTNEICFPAGILQVPFFDMTADDAFNYGAIGVVIGHEMTHGFDDQGRHYDKTGNMTDWWTASDAANFTARTDKYAAFFSQIEVLPELNANGRLTLGENLADHGGLEVAFNAYKHATANAPLPTIDGLTADQRFFLAYAGVWANNITEAEIRNRTKSDPHSLGCWRVNGALPHIKAWYDAFGVTPDAKMYLPETERLQLW